LGAKVVVFSCLRKRLGILAVFALALATAVPCLAASLVGTSTSVDAFHSGSRFYTHCANGHYWVAYHDGVEPVLASSPDGNTWTPRGPIFSSFDPTADGRWAVRYSGNNVIALGFNAADNDRYYRNGTLNGDGTITWNAADASVGLLTATWPQLNAVIANGKPALWRGSAANTTEGALRLGDQLNTPTWLTATAPPEITPTTGGGFSAGAIFPVGGSNPEDLIVLRATTLTPAAAASHRLVALKYDASLNAWDPPTAWYNVSLLGPAGGPFGLTEDLTTEVKDIGDGGAHQRFAAVRDTSGNLHVVYVNRNDDVVHYRKAAGFNDLWTRVSADVTQATQAIDSVALTAGRNNQLYLFYLRTGGFTPFHYRRFNGMSWESENRGASNVGTLRGFGAMESTNGCSVGIAWAEGAGPYNIKFSLIHDCPALQTTEGAGSLTVTAADSFETTFSTAAGGSVGVFYDLQEDPGRLYDLAGGTNFHEALYSNEIQSGGNSYSTDEDDTGPKMDLLEATPTRVRIRREAFYQQDGTAAILAGAKSWEDYSVYPSGRIALRSNLQTTSPVTYTQYKLSLVVHATAVAPFDGWTPFSETDGIFPNLGSEDFSLFVSGSGPMRTDFLQILYQDWAAADATQQSALLGEEWSHIWWEETTGGTLPASETWNFLTYFKPTIFGDNTAPNATERRDDYRFPDSLAILVGSPWLDDGGGDDFNESEAAYALTFDMTNGLRFRIDGGTTTRHKPFFKIREWRSLSDPTAVTFEGMPIDNDLDYRADVKPISRGHRADNLSWHCTVESAGACTPPALDVGGAGSTSGGAIALGRYGNGFSATANTDSISAGSGGSSDFNEAAGALEFWYRPNYDSTSLTPHMLWYNSSGAGNDFFRFEHTGGQLLFEICIDGTPPGCTGGGTNSVTVPGAAYSWRAGEWVHLRTDWDAGTGIRVFVNGTQAGSSLYPTSFGMTHGTTVFGSCSASCPGGGAGRNADGMFDEPHIYRFNMGDPATIAYGGLESNSLEKLASGSANVTLLSGVVDAARRGEYLYFGSDSKFRGLNVALAMVGSGVSPNLQWQYWNGAAWADLEVGFGFTDETGNLTQPDGTIYWTGDPFGWSPYSVNGGPDLYYVRAYLASGDYATQAPVEGLIKTDILLFQYCGDITLDNQEFIFPVPIPTAVELESFEAVAQIGAVELLWKTASELDNLGFHLYRAGSERGPYERITASLIPGLGASPVGARYRYLDSDVTNGITYFYKLEDVETTGRSEMHGPVSAVPSETSGETAPLPSTEPEPPEGRTVITYGNPDATELRIVERGAYRLVLELDTGGFYALPEADGSMRLAIPGFDTLEDSDSLALPIKRAWVDAVAGRKVKLISIRASSVEAIDGWVPSAGAPEVDARIDGTVRLSRRQPRASRAWYRGPGLRPVEAARLAEVGYQGELKKALLELAPLRWEATSRRLLFARRLRVVLSFREKDPDEVTAGGLRGRRYRREASHETTRVVSRLVTGEAGLYAVRFEEVLSRARSYPASGLRLSRLGQSRAFFLEPAPETFGPGSTLYFLSEGAEGNPYGREAVFELELGVSGKRMTEVAAAPSGTRVSFYWQKLAFEENRYYQAGLLEAPDVWLWDVLLSPVRKSYGFRLEGLAEGEASEASHLRVFVQGASDFSASPDHHLRVYVNGSLTAETSFEGKMPEELQLELPPGLLREGENALELENVGDTGASYSMVFLDRFELVYPRWVRGSGLNGRTSESGWVATSASHVLDVTDREALRVRGESLSGGVRFAVEAGRSYLAVAELLRPEVKRVPQGWLKSEGLRADYLLIGPRAFLEAARPLVELRTRQGLRVQAVSMESIVSEFGFGEMRPEAVHDFLSYAYHRWKKPSPRYVLLLGDATYDFKDYLGTGVVNQVPSIVLKTRYLWTASDPALASVNGDDVLPDLAIGRLPAASVEEARAMAAKVVAWERDVSTLEGPAVLVADNPDGAGDFEANAEALAAVALSDGVAVRKIYLRQLGAQATGEAVVDSFEEGASTVSYIGHGGIHLWASENVFDTEAAAALAPQARQPLVLTMNCLNGYFHFPYFNALAEELVKAGGKGAVAAFSPSGLSLNEPAHLLHKALLEEILSGQHLRLGDAVSKAQERFLETGSFPELLAIYHLFGDPALLLR
jgi:hypothetical protein